MDGVAVIADRPDVPTIRGTSHDRVLPATLAASVSWPS